MWEVNIIKDIETQNPLNIERQGRRSLNISKATHLLGILIGLEVHPSIQCLGKLFSWLFFCFFRALHILNAVLRFTFFANHFPFPMQVSPYQHAAPW